MADSTTTPASANTSEALQLRITNRTAKVGVVGLGYVGLPLAVELAQAGFSVTGIDLDQSKVASINHGISYYKIYRPRCCDR